MAKWLIRTFTTDTGSKPVEDWIESLAPEARSEVVLTIEHLRQQGTALRMPVTRYLDGGIWELRTRSEAGICRVLYFHWKGRTFGLLHGFTKKTRTAPHQELDIARARKATWLARTRNDHPR